MSRNIPSPSHKNVERGRASHVFASLIFSHPLSVSVLRLLPSFSYCSVFLVPSFLPSVIRNFPPSGCRIISNKLCLSHHEVDQYVDVHNTPIWNLPIHPAELPVKKTGVIPSIQPTNWDPWLDTPHKLTPEKEGLPILSPIPCPLAFQEWDGSTNSWIFCRGQPGQIKASRNAPVKYPNIDFLCI